MIDHNLSYVEAIPDQTYFDSWKEILLNTGGTQSTLQDIRITERADGFCYKDCETSRYFTRNRFIYWKICHDVLELVEQSLDVNLYSNRIRYRFVDTPILDGVGIHETKDHVVLLVPTVCSVHKLIFPHPRKLHKQDKLLGASSKELKYPSIFSEAVGNESKDTNTFYVFSVPKFTDTQTPQLACSTLGPSGEGLFFLAYPSGDLLLVSHLSSTENSTIELKTDSVVPRFLSGLAEKFISKSSEYTGIVSLSLMTLGNEIFGLSLCREAELKFWSISRKQCVAVVNIFAESGDTDETIKNSQNYVLRKAVDGDDMDCIFGVFVNFVTESKFIILKPVIIGDHIEVRRLFTIHSPERDLIDFTLSMTRLWSVWRTETGSCVVYNSNLNPDSYDSNTWAPVILENLPDSNQVPVHEGDPRQIYLQQIFHPGRFPLHIINKALSIYKKSTLAADVNLSASSLKQRICLAVENEIRNELKEAEVSDEDYLECANWCWQRFYSCCVQYHVAGLKPLGLLLLPSVSGAVLLKKSNISFLRPMDPLEHMILCSEYTSKSQLLRYNLLSENVDMIKQVLQLVSVLVYLEQQVSENFDYAFEKQLLNLKSPEVIVTELIEKIQMEMDFEFCSGIIERLNQIHHLDQVIYKILDILKFEVDMFDEPLNNDLLQLYFSSHLGISVLAKCIQQQAKVRFTISRNLMLITNILTNSKVIERNTLEGIRSVCTPDLILHTQANFVVVWLSSLPVLSFLPQDSIFQRLSPLKLNPMMSINRNILHPVSLLELFISSMSSGELAKIPIEENEEYLELGHWHVSLIPFVKRLFHIVWPVSKNTLLAEWLLVNGQHVWLEQYVRLLKSWCEWGTNTRCFILGVSFLICGDHYKATECFQLAAKGLFSEKFFTMCILKGVRAESESETYMSYYLKVIKLLELHGAKDFAIQIANTALRRIGDSGALAATLYSIKFKHHLSLKHYEMAFYSLNSNPDAERKKDSLRDLVKKLLDERKFDVLLKFSYGSLQELFCNILFTRARAADAINNVYYDFLYTYLVTLGSQFFRKAASVMYEQAFRLGHANTLPALEKQVKCLLASYNILKLVNSKYSWVVKPAPESSTAETVVVIPGRAGTENEDIVLNLKQSVEVVGADDIRKECIVLTAKLKLCKFDEKYFHPDTSPEELIYLLASAGFFKDALSIAELYKASFTPVFEILTSQCIMLSESDDTTDCMWLIENDLQDLAIKKNAAGVAWNLLQDFIEKYEEDKMSVLHCAVCKKIVDMRIHIPYWFLSSYKKRNPSELLRLLHFYGRLQEAVDVAKEYLLAVMGHGSENYGITQPFLATAPPVCFPVRQVDALLYELELQNKKYPDGKYVKEHAILNDMFAHYLTTATRLCIEKCQLRV